MKKRSLNNKFNQEILVSSFDIVLAILFGLFVGAIVISIADASFLDVYREMFSKSFFSMYYLLQTFTRSTPIMICAIATAIAWRAGYINIGVEGQMIVGGFTAAIVSLYLKAPAPILLVVSILMGMFAGGLYASLAGFLYEKFNVSLVISTLMMNYIANYFASYLVTFPLKTKSGDGLSLQTDAIDDSLKFMRLGEGTTFNIGFIIAILVVLFLVFISKKTVFGYESKMTGLNKNFARYGGVDERRTMLKTMFLSGAIASLAGICEIYGVKYRYIDQMFVSTSYAWTGLMSALIARLNPIGIFFSSVFLSGLQVGGQAIQRSSNVPLQMSTVIQASITLFVSAKIGTKYIKKLLERVERKGGRGR